MKFNILIFMHHGLDNSYIYAVSKITLVVSNGVSNVSIQGTGFFVLKGKKLYLITNRHVLEPWWKDSQYNGYSIQSIMFDRRDFDETAKTVDIETLEMKSYKVLFAENNIDDIACITDIHIQKPWSGKTPICIEYSMLANSDFFDKDLSICDSVAIIGFPIVYDHKHNMPILRSGVISSDPRLDYSFNGKDNGHVLAYEAFSTSGASGSPVFTVQKGFKLQAPLKAPDGFYRPVKLIGINAGCIESKQDKVHQQMSYMFKSDQIIKLIEQASVSK